MDDWLAQHSDFLLKLLVAIVWLVLGDDAQGALGRSWPPLVIALQTSFNFTVNVWATPWRWIGEKVWPTCLGLARGLSRQVRDRLPTPTWNQRDVLVGWIVAGVLLVMAAADAVVLGYSLAVTGMANERVPLGPGIPVAPVLAVILALLNIGAGVALGQVAARGGNTSVILRLVIVAIAAQAAVSFLRGWVILDNAPLSLAETGMPMRFVLGFVTAALAAVFAGLEFEMARRLHTELVGAGLHVLFMLLLVATWLLIIGIWLIGLGLAVQATVAIALAGTAVAAFVLLVTLVPPVVASAVLWAFTTANWVPYRLHHWLRIFHLKP